MISLLLTLILGFASDSCNNKDIILILGYNYNLSSCKSHPNEDPGTNLGIQWQLFLLSVNAEQVDVLNNCYGFAIR